MRHALLLIVLTFTACEEASEPEATSGVTPEQEACISRVIETESARALSEAEASLAKSNSAIESGNLEALMDTDLVEEAISDKDSCEAVAACFSDADPINRAMYLQQCTRDKMEERLADQL